MWEDYIRHPRDYHLMWKVENRRIQKENEGGPAQSEIDEMRRKTRTLGR